MARDNPINLRLNSFASFDDAMAMCELLGRETGSEYTVMPDTQLGFTTKRVGSNIDPRKIARETGIQNQEFRQAWRGFISNYLQILIGMLLIINPYQWIGLVFSLLEIDTIPAWFNLKGVGEFVAFGGGLLIVYGLRFIYSFFAEKLYIDDDSFIIKKGIIAQSQVQIRFGDIKTIGVNQGILDRLLGIGTIHLDSAGTNGTVDIEFNNMIDPVSIRRNIQRMIDDYYQNHG